MWIIKQLTIAKRSIKVTATSIQYVLFCLFEFCFKYSIVRYCISIVFYSIGINPLLNLRWCALAASGASSASKKEESVYHMGTLIRDYAQARRTSYKALFSDVSVLFPAYALVRWAV